MNTVITSPPWSSNPSRQAYNGRHWKRFALPLPIQLIHLIPNASLGPLGCHLQETINEKGEKIPKYRMMHNQSFPGPSGQSVNNRVIQDLLVHCMYSFVLLRSLYFIISLWKCHPSTKIFISKFDLDSAYCHCHLSGKTTHECLSIHNGILLMALRMAFGGSPCPSLWGYISDTICDVCNIIISNNHWVFKHAFDPLIFTLDPPKSLPDSVPFHQARNLSVEIPINDMGKLGIYIDEMIAIAPDINENVLRGSYAIPLAIHTLGRPSTDPNPIPQKDIISMKNF